MPRPTTLTAPVSGIYEATPGSSGASADRSTTRHPVSAAPTIVASNGARVADSETISLSTNTVQNLSGLLKLNAGDTVKLTVLNEDSIEATVFGNNSAGLPALSLAWIGPA